MGNIMKNISLSEETKDDSVDGAAPAPEAVEVNADPSAAGVAVPPPPMPARGGMMKLMPQKLSKAGLPVQAPAAPVTGNGSSPGTASQQTTAAPTGPTAIPKDTEAEIKAEAIKKVAGELNTMAIGLPANVPAKYSLTLMKASAILNDVAAGKGIDLTVAPEAEPGEEQLTDKQTIEQMQTTIDQLTASLLAMNAMVGGSNGTGA